MSEEYPENTISVNQEYPAFFRRMATPFFCILFVILAIWIGARNAMPLFLCVIWALIGLLFLAIMVYQAIGFFRYPCVLKADQQGIHTSLLTGKEVAIPWNKTTKTHCYQIMQPIWAPRGRLDLGTLHIKKGYAYISTIEIGIWDRAFVSELEKTGSTRLFKSSIQWNPVRENDPKTWPVKIPIMIKYVNKDLNAIVEQMNRFRENALSEEEKDSLKNKKHQKTTNGNKKGEKQ